MTDLRLCDWVVFLTVSLSGKKADSVDARVEVCMANMFVVSTHGQNDLCECTRCIVGKVVPQGLGMCKSIYKKCTC